jgi:O-methyltransferase involved in polyketide biosynthesis
MDTAQQQNIRDYALVSPSAKSLLLLKGLTNIPFAKETAAFISLPGQYNPDMNSKDFAFWKRVVHFEDRYWSVDQLLSQFTINNILEISSGYSLRGLQMVKENSVHYIDTDLAEVIAQKKELMKGLPAVNKDIKGCLEMMPLNALDENRFNEVVSAFPEGPIVIVNEGLLMYLNNGEKERLCKIIHQVLKLRGGYWITGDIYIKTTMERFDAATDDSLKELIEQQGIEQNMFDSFDVAADFFKRSGFVMDKEAATDHAAISSLPYLISNATNVQLKELMSAPPKIRATWCLKVDSDN